MRSFEERKAEVFHRSGNRIRERKRNRNRILALSIPLCLILTVWSAAVFPFLATVRFDNAEKESVGNIPNELEGSDGESNIVVEHYFVSVDVKGICAESQYQSTISDISSVNDVFAQIYTILISHEIYKDIIGDGNIGVTDSGVSNDIKDFTNETKASGYNITMTTENGLERTFTLTDNILYDVELNIEITLTDEQITGLKTALGLTD